jgi:hypothetical protein
MNLNVRARLRLEQQRPRRCRHFGVLEPATRATVGEVEVQPSAGAVRIAIEHSQPHGSNGSSRKPQINPRSSVSAIEMRIERRLDELTEQVEQDR